MATSRRQFLRTSGRSMVGLAGLLHFGRVGALAQTTGTYRALVCVFLNGGNDGNNTIVPLQDGGYQRYAAARSGLALPQTSLVPVATPSGDQYGLHPQLAPLQRLFQQRTMAVVANVGVLVRPLTRNEYLAGTAPLPRNLYSHIDQQMQWQSAVPTGSATTGWGGRTADRLASVSPPSAFPAVVSVAGNTLFGTGRQTVPTTIIPGEALGLAGLDETAADAARIRAFEELLTLDSGAVLIHAASHTMREGLRVSRLLESALASRGSLATRFPTSSIGQQLAEIAKVIQVRAELGVDRQLFFCAVNGFDTHAGQFYQQNLLLRELAEALTAFYDATIEMDVEQQVTTFTESEFGRTLQPTSSTGSDHAWGSHHLVMGNSVNGGRIYGRFPTLALGGPDDAGDRGVWIPTSSLDQYGATLASWFGVSEADLPIIFPNLANFSNTNLGFLS